MLNETVMEKTVYVAWQRKGPGPKIPFYQSASVEKNQNNVLRVSTGNYCRRRVPSLERYIESRNIFFLRYDSHEVRGQKREPHLCSLICQPVKRNTSCSRWVFCGTWYTGCFYKKRLCSSHDRYWDKCAKLIPVTGSSFQKKCDRCWEKIISTCVLCCDW